MISSQSSFVSSIGCLIRIVRVCLSFLLSLGIFLSQLSSYLILNR